MDPDPNGQSQAAQADACWRLATADLEAGKRVADAWHRDIGRLLEGGSVHRRWAARQMPGCRSFRKELYERATAEYARALELYRHLGDRSGEAWVLYRLAVMWSREGHHDLALAEFTRARELYAELHDEVGEANVVRGLSELGRVSQRVRELLPVTSAEQALRRESDCRRWFLLPTVLLVVLFVALWALIGLDPPWPFLPFAVGLGLVQIMIKDSRAPLKEGRFLFVVGALVAVAIWALTGRGSTLPFLVLLFWGWSCGSGVVKGQQRLAGSRAADTDAAIAEGEAWLIALAEAPASGRGPAPEP